MRSAVFAEQDLSTALERSKAERRVLLVDATSRGARPSTTWSDPRVVTAVAEHAIAIQLDLTVDHEVATQLRVTMPMVVAFADGAEIDRVSGPQRPRAFAAWVKGLSHGVTSESASAVIEAGRTRARQLFAEGHFESATTQFAEVWRQIADALWRRTLVSDVQRLIRQYPPAREVFATLRDELATTADDVDTETLSDWVTLNKLIDDPETTLRWFDQLEKTRLPDLRWAFWTEREIVELLVARERWADAGAALADPGATLRQAHSSLRGFESQPDSEITATVRPQFVKKWRTTATQLVRALGAAERLEEVHSVNESARRFDPSPEMAGALDEALSKNVSSGSRSTIETSD